MGRQSGPELLDSSGASIFVWACSSSGMDSRDGLIGEEKGVFWRKLVPAGGGDNSVSSLFSSLILVKRPSSLQAVVLLWRELAIGGNQLVL